MLLDVSKGKTNKKSMHAKANQSIRFRNGLGVRYYPVARYALIDYQDVFELNIPLEMDQLELPTFLLDTLEDGRKGDIKQNVWENPEIKDLDKQLTGSMSIALSYQILLTFLGLQGTRDIWLTFPNTHHSLLSYLKNRAFEDQSLLKYKTAMLTCVIRGYGLDDSTKIERVFERCGLSRQNAIFYILFSIENRDQELEFDTQDVMVLTVADMEKEIDEFCNEVSTYRLCRFHVNKSLLFIVNANRFSKDEMANELMIATKTAYTLCRPFKSKLFSANYARRCMTNMVTRIIHAHTHYESKIRIVSTEDGYENTHQDLSNLDTSSITDDDTFDNLKTSMHFSEDSMIDYLDSIRRVA